MSHRLSFPIPAGWFGVAWSEDGAAGELRPIRCYGCDRVPFRPGSDGAGMMDAYCLHLGAHLGHGGRVDGDEPIAACRKWANPFYSLSARG